ncbi:MAG TPA: mRNA surveillance protein pelota [Candidatus Norongarragalinales archaeon]|nr:mRNA surveillance protein pelota [Candidatus Norongarragalinales archaeon]
MKLIHRNDEKLKLSPQFLEDLWYLTKIVSVNDVVEGYSFRSFKTEGLNRPVAPEKKKVKLEIKVENVEFAESVNKLRLTGIILSGSPEEYVSFGEHHTLDVELNDSFVLKKRLSSLEESYLQEALKKTARTKITMVVMDEHQALLAKVDIKGVKFVGEIENRANKRDPKGFDSLQGAFFQELAKTLEGEEILVIAGPGFARENFKKFLGQKKPDLLEKAYFEHCSNAEQSGVYELLKNKVLEKVMKNQRIAMEFALFEEFKMHLAKQDGLVAYGLEEVAKAVEYNAVEKLAVLDELVRKNRTAYSLVEKAREKGAELVIFDSNDDAGREFEAFKIAALLRFKIA